MQRLNAGKQIVEGERFSRVRNAQQRDMAENFKACEDIMFLVGGFGLGFGAAGRAAGALGGRGARGAEVRGGVGF